VSRARRLLVLFGRMLRYRVALMLWLFMLLGAALHGGLSTFRASYLVAGAALGFAYVAATTVNDIADEGIDRVNHPADRGRPLVSGDASANDLRVLHRAAVAGALVCGAALGPAGLLLAGLSILIGRAYSLAPMRISYRTYAAPAVLGIAYVLIPYALGVVAAGGRAGRTDAVLAAALYALFLARINLKDFRDREGDARFGRPTLLLRFGKTVTCVVSAVALAAGDLLLLAAVRPAPAVAVLWQVFVCAIAWELGVLWRSPAGRDEQVAIGTGARMGNGLLLAVLGCLLLRGQAAPSADQALFALAIAMAFGAGFWALASHPDHVSSGTRADPRFADEGPPAPPGARRGPPHRHIPAGSRGVHFSSQHEGSGGQNGRWIRGREGPASPRAGSGGATRRAASDGLSPARRRPASCPPRDSRRARPAAR
jgi:4-hydroxybenzoate polyprenyltransferase